MADGPEAAAPRSSTHILDLNDDCLDIIFKQLDLLGQYKMAKLHSRFLQVTRGLWNRQHFRLTINPELLRRIEQLPDSFESFMRVVGPHSKILTMDQCHISYLRQLGYQAFPQYEVFNWNGNPIPEDPRSRVYENEFSFNVEFFNDEDVVLLERVFPNLKCVFLESTRITGHQLYRLSTLRHLNLVECRNLDSECLPLLFHRLQLVWFNIMRNCYNINSIDLMEVGRCPTLQIVKIADHQLRLDANVLDVLLRLPRLEILYILVTRFIMAVMDPIARTRLKQIVAFKFSGIMPNVERFFGGVAQMQHLTKLFFHNSRGRGVEFFWDEVMMLLSRELSVLEELHIRSCEVESDEGLLAFVENCRHLLLIDVSFSRGFSIELIWRSIDILINQENRLGHFYFWLYDTEIPESILRTNRFLNHGGLVRLDFRHCLRDENPPGVMKFTFKTA